LSIPELESIPNTELKFLITPGIISGQSSVSPPPSWVEALRSPHGDLPILAAQMANVPPRYWFNGAECAVGDIFEHVATNGDYSPSDVVSGIGLTTSGGATTTPTMTAAVFALIATGATAVIDVLWDGTTAITSDIFFFTDDPEYSFYDETYIDPLSSVIGSGKTVAVGDGQFVVSFAAGVNRIATTLLSTSGKVSVNGGLVNSGAYSDPLASANICATDLVTAAGSAEHANAIPNFYLYPPQPESDLPTLSAV